MKFRQSPKSIAVAALFLLFFLAAGARGHEGHMPIIVDTDGAVDDIRAIAQMLDAGADIRLIVTSDGVLSPENGLEAVKRTLAYFGRTDIPVAAGSSLDAPPPEWRTWNSEMNWPAAAQLYPSDEPEPAGAKAAIVKRIKNLSESGQQALYLCLGPMTNLAAALRDAPQIKKGIARVIYLGSAPASETTGWNTKRDPSSAGKVFNSGLPVYAMGLAGSRFPVFDESLYERISRMQSDSARLITSIHKSGKLQEKLAENHLRIWDELAVLYLYHPGMFEFTDSRHGDEVMRLADYDSNRVRKNYLAILENAGMPPRRSVTLKSFPTDPALFKKDLAPHVPEIIEAHGLEEWKACLLTNELHRHLGGYSLVGAKMGVRAREILKAPFDTLEVVSFAGSSPPLSCMNDGLQTSTDASLGRGTIRVAETHEEPAAMFVHHGRALHLTLKPRYVRQIKTDIQAALKRFGGLTPEYFARIRELSIAYWQDFDRTRIFEEKLKTN